MRALHYILRFLGISLILLWLLGKTVFAQDNDVTVNFPDEMTVSGSVEITNLGITGDPSWLPDPTPTTEPTVFFNNQSTNLSTVPTGSAETSISTTYLSGWKKICLLDLTSVAFSGNYDNSVQAVDNDDYKVFLTFPSFNWTTLKTDFGTVLFGARFSQSDANLYRSLFPGVTARGTSLESNTTQKLNTKIQNFFVSSSPWSFNLDWSGLSGVNNDSYTFFQGYGANVKPVLTYVLCFLGWYECIYLVICKISKA